MFFSGALRAQIEIEIAPKFCSFLCISNFNVKILELEGGGIIILYPRYRLLADDLDDD